MGFSNFIRSKWFLFTYITILIIGFFFFRLMNLSLFSYQFASIAGVLLFVIVLFFIIILLIKPTKKYNVSLKNYIFDYIISGISMTFIFLGVILIYMGIFEVELKFLSRFFLGIGGFIASIIGLIIFIKHAQKYE